MELKPTMGWTRVEKHFVVIVIYAPKIAEECYSAAIIAWAVYA